jgi:flagellar biosynthetic protein FlhB
VGIARGVFGLVARVAVAILAIGLIDWVFQKWNYKKRHRMTKQEVRDEMKEKEVSPLIKRRIRGIQIEMVRKRMLQEVPQADVVLTNPTHVAVALRYDPPSMEAPMVVAKGPDLLSEKIKEIARIHNVPIVQRPELARTIYASVEVGEAVPETLFVAVAEILAMVYRTRKKRPFPAGERRNP